MKIEDMLAKAKQFVEKKAPGTSRKRKILLGCLVAGAVSLAVTNPKREAYLVYASGHLPARAEKACARISPRIDIQILIFKVPAGDACQSLVSGSGRLLIPFSKWAIGSKTDSPMNFILFSVYTTDLNVVGIKPLRTIGIANQFIGLPW